jgi:hypothetical protein
MSLMYLCRVTTVFITSKAWDFYLGLTEINWRRRDQQLFGLHPCGHEADKR